jgi:N-acetylglucosamine kinase
MTSNLNIGVDGGGTKTRAVVVDDALRVLGRGEAGSSNHYSVGVERAAENAVSLLKAPLKLRM